MNNPFNLVILASLILNLILVAALVFIVMRLLKNNSQKTVQVNINEDEDAMDSIKVQKLDKKSSNMSHRVMLNDQVRQMKEMYDQLQTSSGEYCSDHPDLVSVGVCAISGKNYCEHCLKSFQSLKIGKKYMNLYLDHEWAVFMTLAKESTFADPPKEVLDLKYRLWSESQIPVIVQSQFKINIDSDEVESFIVLKARTMDIDVIQSQFEEIVKNNQEPPCH